MQRARRHELLWELVDSMFMKVEYWNEDPTLTTLTDDEYDYLMKVISMFAVSNSIMNHVRITRVN